MRSLASSADAPPEHRQLARIRKENRHDHPDARRLAGAARADDAVESRRAARRDRCSSTARVAPNVFVTVAEDAALVPSIVLSDARLYHADATSRAHGLPVKACYSGRECESLWCSVLAGRAAAGRVRPRPSRRRAEYRTARSDPRASSGAQRSRHQARGHQGLHARHDDAVQGEGRGAAARARQPGDLVTATLVVGEVDAHLSTLTQDRTRAAREPPRRRPTRPTSVSRANR